MERALADMDRARAAFRHRLTVRETGVVSSVATGVAHVTGLPGTGYEELILFPGGLYGIALDLDEDGIDVVLLGDHTQLQAGDAAERTGRVMDVPVGEALLGRVIDPLGAPRDGKGPIMATERLPIERPSPAIMDRAPVNVPLHTGITVVDALVPIGRGQRELILGDRSTGKTTIAVDTILNQQGTGVISIYCAINQRAASVAQVMAKLQEHHAMERTIVVVAEGDQAPGLAFIAPYAATSMAEHFMEQGKDVLIVYDDLTHHARAHREISLLLRRAPGREAFPGDVFYVHSRLLERATHLIEERGGGSLTALPVIETEAQDISAYIPTNLISITDGQIYLSHKLFDLGVLPAVDVTRSVSRVGGKAQLAAYRKAIGSLKLDYAQFEELESFARFGTQLDDHTRTVLAHGERIRACLKQAEASPLSMPEQIVLLTALTNGLFDAVAMEHMPGAQLAVRAVVKDLPDEVVERFTASKAAPESDRETVLEACRNALAAFVKTSKAL